VSRASSDPIVEEITIDASAERVFEALVNPEERVTWWGADGSFQTTHMESDLRPGGRWQMRGRRMDGQPFAITGEYREIVRPHVLVFTWLPDWQANASVSIVRIDLDEHDGVTTVRLTHSGLTPEELRTGHRGWPQILTWLRAHSEKHESKPVE
jgi:uncharacterized protein YndB with AHSA1/START domain